MQPVTLAERLSHIEKAKKQLGTTIPWIADSMTNELKNALGDRNNSEIVVTPDSIMTVARDWSDPAALRIDLEKLVGKADTLTQVSELDLKVVDDVSDHPDIPTRIVPRLDRPDDSEALLVKATGEGPHYLKLRTEAEKSVSRGSGGTLHLSFQMDPIHEVHWNNLAPPMKFTIDAPEGVTIDPPSGEAAKVTAAESDLDPREFLAEITGGSADAPLTVTVDYFACDDAGKWCKPVTQIFEITLEVDRNAGRVQPPGGRSQRGKMKGGPGGGRGMPDPDQILSRFDTNNDGSLTKDEATGPMERRFDQVDVDDDGILTGRELKAFFENR